MHRLAPLTLALALGTVTACKGREAPPHGDSALRTADGPPDEAPHVVSGPLPFRYPPALYEKKVQGNVTLRLFIDRDGQVRPESTRVEESSGFPPLDSAAVQGSHELRFVPAKVSGEAVAVPILFPVYFRHPEAAPLPGDTVLRGTRDSGLGTRPSSTPAAPRP